MHLVYFQDSYSGTLICLSSHTWSTSTFTTANTSTMNSKLEVYLDFKCSKLYLYSHTADIQTDLATDHSNSLSKHIFLFFDCTKKQISYYYFESDINCHSSFGKIKLNYHQFFNQNYQFKMICRGCFPILNVPLSTFSTECGVFRNLSAQSFNILWWFTGTEICETHCSYFLRVLHDDFEVQPLKSI